MNEDLLKALYERRDKEELSLRETINSSIELLNANYEVSKMIALSINLEKSYIHLNSYYVLITTSLTTDEIDELLLGPIHRLFDCTWEKYAASAENVTYCTNFKYADRTIRLEIIANVGPGCVITPRIRRRTRTEYEVHCTE